MDEVHWRWDAFADLGVEALYRIIGLREAVFVVEQACVYLDADGKDPDCWHLSGWRDGALVAYLRVLPVGIGYTDVVAIGRVVVAPGARGEGLGDAVMIEGLRRIADICGCGRIRLSAQAHLEGWYRRLGFVLCGPEYDEDGIPHVPMETWVDADGRARPRRPV